MNLNTLLATLFCIVFIVVFLYLLYSFLVSVVFSYSLYLWGALFCFVIQLSHSILVASGKDNLTVPTVRSLVASLFFPKKHYVFKKLDFTINPYFWQRTSFSNLYYQDQCDEKPTVNAIHSRINDRRPEQTLELYVEGFLVSLFAKTHSALLSNNFSTDAASTDDIRNGDDVEFGIFTEQYLRQQLGVNPLFGNCTPDVAIRHQIDERVVTVFFDSVCFEESKDFSRVSGEKLRKYTDRCDILVVFGFSRAERKLNIQVHTNEDSFYNREMYRKLMAKRYPSFPVEKNAIAKVSKLLNDQHHRLEAEYQYWDRCMSLRQIIRSKN